MPSFANDAENLAFCLALFRQKCPALARVFDAWPTLPDHIKEAILALVEVARPGRAPT
jgi:hypothetical protein